MTASLQPVYLPLHQDQEYSIFQVLVYRDDRGFFLQTSLFRTSVVAEARGLTILLQHSKSEYFIIIA